MSVVLILTSLSSALLVAAVLSKQQESMGEEGLSGAMLGLEPGLFLNCDKKQRCMRSFFLSKI